ncbi:MAG: methylated-DNA--[protein]-cysteine S-methyltransferase [Bryobacteraceae bacterium]
MLEWTEVRVVDAADLLLVASASGIRAIEFDPQPVSEWPRNDGNPLLLEAASQLRAYFAGALHEFLLPLDIEGTDFQKRVWGQVAAIPYGETRSYLQIAVAIGSPRAVRAVGAANGANPVPIVVPCHRVIGAHGELVGYGGGLAMKKRLLELEGCTSMSFPITEPRPIM